MKHVARAWLIQSPNGKLMPEYLERTKKFVKILYENERTYLSPTWERMEEDGFRIVQVEIRLK